MMSSTKRLIYSKQQIKKRVEELALQISEDFEGSEIITVGILKGAFIFLADLIRSIRIPVKIDFIRLASYGSGMISSGKIAFIKDLELSIEGQNVILVEDIVDSGLTLSYLIEELRSRSPRSLKTCVFLDKRERREKDISLDYVGFKMDKGFVIGYGLDWDERYRYLPEIFTIDP